ncbi:olfactory receptor 49-like [Pseudonaja textilis]|uniref:olfactory receptor 49-like n=1 Tax=Pseudonaja textilis TaxID=8673 RepID=UPI000EAA59E7|nr:olfactory receptor 49-like [Pseudonaja textilis]
MNANSTTPIEFVLLGISERTDLQTLLFAVFLIIYFFILMGNLIVFVATIYSQALHTPMYFFLRHLSFLDICYTSVILPQMLVHFITKRKIISFLGCAMQMFFYIFLGTAICYLLAVMAYDRYLAICHPLHYIRLMTRRTCFLFVSSCWIIGLFVSLLQTWLIFSLPLCGSNVINHFFCDISPLMRLNYPSKLLSLIYTMAPAMLNPVIYSLRNKPVKDAIKEILAKFCMSR